MQSLPKIRISFKEACTILSIGRDSLYKLIDNDPAFPRPIKDGITKQSPVYFDYQSLIKWWNQKQTIA